VRIPKAGEHGADHGEHKHDKERGLQDDDEWFFQVTPTARRQR